MFSKPDQHMTLQDTARLLDVPEQAVLRWARKGALPCHNVQGEPRFRRNDVEGWARQMGMKLRTTPGGAPHAEPNALACSMRRGGLVQDLSGSTVPEALESLVAAAPPPGVEPTGLLQLLLARERLASTAVGEGVALPHPRQPLAQLAEPRVVVARLARPVDWSSLDQVPVRLLLLVLSNSLKGHLDILARVAQALKTPQLRAALEDEPDLETMCRVVEAWPE